MPFTAFRMTCTTSCHVMSTVYPPHDLSPSITPSEVALPPCLQCSGHEAMQNLWSHLLWNESVPSRWTWDEIGLQFARNCGWRHWFIQSLLNTVSTFYRCILGSSKSLVAWFSSCRLKPGSWSCLPTGDKTSLTGLKHMQQKNTTDIFKACLCNGSHKVWLCIEYMKRSRLHDSAWFHMSTITMYITQHTNIST